MDDLKGKYRLPHRGFDVDVGGNSAVLTQTFVKGSLQHARRNDDGLDAVRGAMNGLLISLVFWIALGLVLFSTF